MPVAISCNCSSLSLAISSIKGRSKPNSALVPVMTQIFLIAQLTHLPGNLF